MTDRTADPIQVKFTLNGETISRSGQPMMRLSRLLRDDLRLTGTKIGCDAGDCGACTILLNGRQVCACLVPLAQIDGSRIETVEGIGEADSLSALQASFHHHGAAQCGICTPGMLMAATDLLSENARPSETEVQDALGGVLCRCTGYRKIIEAVVHAHEFGGDCSNFKEILKAGYAVGSRLPRVDGIGKLIGQEAFGADQAPEDSLWLRVVRSPHARAAFTVGDLVRVTQETTGLTAIFTGADVPGENSFGIYPDLKDQPVLAVDAVRYRGEAVLALVGERETVEGFPIETLPIRWTEEKPVCGSDEAVSPGAKVVHASHPDNILLEGHVEKGDVDLAEETAAVVASGTIATPHVEHAYIEPEAGYARRLPDTPHRLEVVACTQTPYMDRIEVARVLGISEDDVRIVPTGCGGGFGGKLDVSIQPLLAIAAWLLERPVRGIYNRPESMASTTKRHPVRANGTATADQDGKLRSVRIAADFNTGAYASWGPTVADRVPVHGSGPYFVPSVHIHSRAIYTNDTPAGAFRGFGVPQVSILQESLFDDLAEQLKIDPLEFRLLNAIRCGQPTSTGQILNHSVGMTRCLEELRPHWQRLRAEAEHDNAQSKAPSRRRGVGIGCMWYGCGNTSLPNPSTIHVRFRNDGRLTLYNGAADIGQGSTTVILQICADALGLLPNQFELVIGDTDRTADAGKTSASRQTFVSGRAAFLAGQDLRNQVLALAGRGSDAKLKLHGSMLLVTDSQGESSVELGQLPLIDEIDTVLQGKGTFDPPTAPLDDKGQGIPYATYGFAAQLCDLEVDLGLGTIHLRRFVAAHDMGKAINPTLVEGQIHGGIAQGIGLALLEEYLPGRTENLHDYLIPTFGDVPEIDIVLIEESEPLGPYGAKGIGEPALVATAPAIFGGVRHATGVRVTQAPLTPHRMLDLLDQQVAK